MTSITTYSGVIQMSYTVKLVTYSYINNRMINGHHKALDDSSGGKSTLTLAVLID